MNTIKPEPADGPLTASKRGVWRLGLTLLLPVLAMTSLSVRSQSFDISWFTIDGGGGTSTGGIYSVSGSIGQPDAGTLSGWNYQLTGGFWSVISAIQMPGAPLLSVGRSNATVIVFWPLPASGFILDETPTLTGTPPPWAPVAFPYETNGSYISISVPAPDGNKFYRLRKP